MSERGRGSYSEQISDDGMLWLTFAESSLDPFSAR